MSVTVGDLVISGSKIGSCVDEINMEVAIIILFELSWLELVLLYRTLNLFQCTENLIDDFFILWISWLILWWLVLLILLFFWSLHFDLLRNVGWNLSFLCNSNNCSLVSVFRDIQSSSDQI